MASCAHRSIRHCLSMIAPFSPHPDYPEEGQRQLYDFFRHVYQGMLAAPEDYFVFPAHYEAYMEKNRQRLEEKRGIKNHFSDSRESTLRNAFQQAIQFYAVFLYESGLAAIEEESGQNQLALTLDDHRRILDKMEKRHGSQWNAARYELLEGLGLKKFITENRAYYRMENYPCMMDGLMILCKAKENKYHFMNYLRLDFKNAGAAPDMADILLTLPEESRKALLLMHDKAASLGIKYSAKLRPLRGITSDFQWKMEFAGKGKNIWGFYADEDHLKICIYFNSPHRISSMADELTKECPHLLPWYQDQFAQRLCKCPYNRSVHLGNMKKRICGFSCRLEMDYPSPKDLQNAFAILHRLHSIKDN